MSFDCCFYFISLGKWALYLERNKNVSEKILLPLFVPYDQEQDGICIVAWHQPMVTKQNLGWQAKRACARSNMRD